MGHAKSRRERMLTRVHHRKCKFTRRVKSKSFACAKHTHSGSMPAYLQEQKKWYLKNRDKFDKKYLGKWIGLRDNKVVAEADDDLELYRILGTHFTFLLIKTEAYERKFPNSKKALVVPVGLGDVEKTVLPIDVKLFREHVLTTGGTETLTYGSVAHSQEYEIDPSFVTSGRFQEQPDPYNLMFFQRPVISTLMESYETKQPKVVSFITDPGSPLSFLSERSLVHLELLGESAIWNYDIYEKRATRVTIFGASQLWRISRDHFSEINIIGCNIIHKCKLEIDYKHRIVNLLPNKQDL